MIQYLSCFAGNIISGLQSLSKALVTPIRVTLSNFPLSQYPHDKIAFKLFQDIFKEADYLNISEIYQSHFNQKFEAKR